MNRLKGLEIPLAALVWTASAAYAGLASAQSASSLSTATPIKHVIIVVGENHTFDNLFGTYQPRRGQTIDNLLSKGIVTEDGTPGEHFRRARQFKGLDTGKYHAQTRSLAPYEAEFVNARETAIFRIL